MTTYDVGPVTVTGAYLPPLPAGPAPGAPAASDLLEAVHVGLTAEQELRARALTEAVSTFTPADIEELLPDDLGDSPADVHEAATDIARALAAIVLPLADRYATWIDTGKLPTDEEADPRQAVAAALRALDPDGHGRLITVEAAMAAADVALADEIGGGR